MNNETSARLKSAGLDAANYVLDQLGWEKASGLERGTCGDPYNCAISNTISKHGPRGKITKVVTLPQAWGPLNIGVVVTEPDAWHTTRYSGDFSVYSRDAVDFTIEFDQANFPELIERRP